MKLRTFYALTLITFVFSLCASIFPVPVFAGSNNDTSACQIIIAASFHVSPNQINSGTRGFSGCKTGYDSGYQNPTVNTDPGSAGGVCYGIADPTDSAFCSTGYRKGQQDKKAGTPQPSSGAIQSKANSLCQPYQTQKNVDNTTKANNFNACVSCYKTQASGGDTTKATGGYNGSQQDACLHGIQAAKDGKSVIVRAASNPINTPAATTPTTSGGSSGLPACEDTSGFGLGWIVCKVIEAMAATADWIYTSVVQPLLATDPINITNPSHDPTHTYEIWSQFRVYGDIFLVIALLVLVFGESIGGGMIDAYNVKKILPRLLIAAVLINLSIYLVALALDITDILGKGLGALLQAPFQNVHGAFNLSVNAGAGALGIVLFLGAGAAVWALKTQAIMFILALVLVPVVLMFFAIMATVIFRRGLIMLLILVSPVAFALYCLPNTEKYFRKWWETLFKTLLVYPIIAVAFAMGNILSVTMSSTTTGLVTGAISGLLSMIALFVPLAMIPFSFRIAGGVMGQAFNAIDGVRQRADKALEPWQQRRKSAASRASVQSRQNLYSSLQDSASRGGTFRRRGLGGLARAVGGFNIEARSSAVNAEVAKEMNDQIATGKDDEIRGLMVDKRRAEQLGRGVGWRMHDGKKQYKSLGGAWVDEADVDAGQRRWKGSAYAHQAALSYEMRKADTEEDVQNIASEYHNVAKGGGLTDQQAAGAWIGAAFQNQDKHLQLKYTDWQTGRLSNTEGFMSEVYEKRGSYNMAQMHAQTIDEIIAANAQARNVLANNPSGLTGQARANEVAQAQRIQSRAADIAENFVSRWGGGGGALGGEEAQQAAARAAQQAGAPAATVQTNAPGAAHVAQRVRQLAVETGVYQPLDSASDTRSRQAPPPIDRQN